MLSASAIQVVSTECQLTPVSNSSRPFGLNPDVLCNIFSLVAEDCPPRSPLVSVRGDLGWIGLTHVCRYWREVGIGHSILWGRVLCTFPSAFGTILSRISVDSPLVVTFDERNSFSSDNAQFRLIDESPNRLEVLQLCASADSLRALSGKDYPQLQSLSLKQRYSYTRPPFFYDKLPITMNTSTVLSLDGYLVPFIAPALRSMSITGHAEGRWAISIVHALDILEGCPVLEELTLSDIFHQREELPPESEACGDRVVFLKYLHNASITTNDIAFATLWQHLTAPAISTLTITSFDSVSHGHPSHPAVIFTAIRPILAKVNRIEFPPYSYDTLSGSIIFGSTHSAISCGVVFCAPIELYVSYFHAFSSALTDFLLVDQIHSLVPGQMIALAPPLLNFTSQSLISLTVNLFLFEAISGAPEFNLSNLLLLIVEVVYLVFDSLDEFEDAWEALISGLRDRAHAGRTLHALCLVRGGGQTPEFRLLEAAAIKRAREYVIHIMER